MPNALFPIASVRIAQSLALCAVVALAACSKAPTAPESEAVEPAANQITLAEAWARETAPGQDNGGAFMRIVNAEGVNDRLLSASSPMAERIELHVMAMDGNIMRMRQVQDGLDLATGESLTLGPGGTHLMLVDLKHPLERGTILPITLQFEKAGTIDVAVPVLPVESTGPELAANG